MPWKSRQTGRYHAFLDEHDRVQRLLDALEIEIVTICAPRASSARGCNGCSMPWKSRLDLKDEFEPQSLRCNGCSMPWKSRRDRIADPMRDNAGCNGCSMPWKSRPVRPTSHAARNPQCNGCSM